MAAPSTDVFMKVLLEGDATTWDESLWTFDSTKLTALPVRSAAEVHGSNESSGSGPEQTISPLDQGKRRRLDAPPAATACNACHAGPTVFGAFQVKEELVTGVQAVTELGAEGGIVLETLDKDECGSRGQQCAVRGCGASLDGLRDFHKRYRICADHVRAPRVLRNGRVERFCQQCSRFHSVSEFDGLKRSCRTQLSRHNQRRRKRASPCDALPAAADDGAPCEAKAAHASAHASAEETLLALPAGMQDLGSLAARPAVVDLSSAGPPALPVQKSGDFVQTLMQTLMCMPTAAMSLKNLLCGESDAAGVSEHVAACLVTGRQLLASNALCQGALRVLRISCKLLRCTPASMPSQLQDHFLSWLQCSPRMIQGSIRPGCVFLTLDMTVTESERQQVLRRGASSLVQHLISIPNEQGGAFWRNISMMCQVGDLVACVSEGRFVDCQTATIARLPTLPCVMDASSNVVLTDGCTPVTLNLKGQNLLRPGVKLIARSGSCANLLQSIGACADGTVNVTVRPPPQIQEQPYRSTVVWLEANMGGYLSPAVPVLFTSSIQVGADVQSSIAEFRTRLLAPSVDAAYVRECIESVLVSIAGTRVAAAARSDSPNHSCIQHQKRDSGTTNTMPQKVPTICSTNDASPPVAPVAPVPAPAPLPAKVVSAAVSAGQCSLPSAAAPCTAAGGCGGCSAGRILSMFDGLGSQNQQLAPMQQQAPPMQPRPNVVAPVPCASKQMMPLGAAPGGCCNALNPQKARRVAPAPAPAPLGLDSDPALTSPSRRFLDASFAPACTGWDVPEADDLWLTQDANGNSSDFEAFLRNVFD